MLKTFLIIAGLVLIGFLIMDESYNFSITALGYEFTFSIALLIVGFIILMYIVHLIKKPFGWIKNYRTYRFQKNILKKENFLTFVLTTVLDKNNVSEDIIRKKEKSLFAKGSNEALLFEALFHPSDNVFEALKNNKETELAGARGLFLSAKAKGDIDTQIQILDAAAINYPNVIWIYQERLNLYLLQNDWENALPVLEQLNKQSALKKEEYNVKKACILYGLKRFKEAFNLTPDNPVMAWAYAETDTKKAEDILKESWAKNPAWKTYELYYELIKNEPAAKQMKLIEKFTAKNTAHKLSLLAVADVAMKNHLWGVAKETLENATNSYELTYQMAMMMATLERNGWHHEEAAKMWEEKATQAEAQINWICKECRHPAKNWEISCPMCNTCGGLTHIG